LLVRMRSTGAVLSSAPVRSRLRLGSGQPLRKGSDCSYNAAIPYGLTADELFAWVQYAPKPCESRRRIELQSA
jgi:hypothetical protein